MQEKKIATPTCKISRLRFSSTLVLIPPTVILARQRRRKTTCSSAPCAIISSTAAIWLLTSYEARRSAKLNLVFTKSFELSRTNLLCCISRDLLNCSVFVRGSNISDNPVSARMSAQADQGVIPGHARSRRAWCSDCKPPSLPTKSRSCATVFDCRFV